MFYQLILLFLLSISNSALGSGTIAIIGDTNSVFNIGKSGAYFIDEEQNLSLSTIMSDDYAKRFRPINKDYLQFGLVKGNVWIRSDVAIRVTDNMPVLLEISAPRLQYLDIYLPNLYENQIQAELGDARPYNNRPIKSANYVFSIPPNAPPVFSLYIKLSSHLPINAGIEIKTLSQMSIDAQQDSVTTGLLVGVLVTLFISNIFFFIKTSHPMYLIYGGLLIGIGTLHLSLHGLMSPFFPNTIGIQERIYNFAALSCLCAIVLFSRLYLDTKKYLPKMDAALIATGAICALFAVIFTFSPDSLNIAVLSVISASTLILLTLHAVLAFVKEVPFSGYYLIARLILFTGYFTWLLSVYGVIPSELLFQWGLTLTIIIEAMIHFIGMIVQTTPLLKKHIHTLNSSQTETFDLLFDLSSRLRRQVNIISGSLTHLEQAAVSNDTRQFITSSLTAKSNIQNLIERIDLLSDIKSGTLPEQHAPISLYLLLNNAHHNIQRLDQDNASIELNVEKTEHIEVLQDAITLQNLIESILQEFKHFTDQTLTLEAACHEASRDGITLLDLNCFPIPTRIHNSQMEFDLGINYIHLLVQSLNGKIHLSDDAHQRRLTIQIPIRAHVRHTNIDTTKQGHFDIILFGQKDDDLQNTFTLLQSYPNKIEHFTRLEHLLEYLDLPEKRKCGSIILMFDNGGHILHISQQKLLPLMRIEDQCLLISNDVRMSHDYAKKLGFDELLSSAELESQLGPQISRLIQKGDRLKNSALSRINPLRKRP
ncbi:hypothetical protein HGG82_12205 [Marinomonas sp. M1K-6]|uniref:7TM-DISM receptor extracellular domain-containing protein n=1 Tax=Marinomonas profundi TaxID=2726122 RepID=A0A847RAW8_9GAMM|nr:7TM diverse intracellular signaling domain-containing protein [Marinomonas profundi]NLQ18377.1 hypothetical protein [Marinomonas profundi]UDV02436.1 hypothetical protein J8N69_12660 [Marinomonas profundi]